LHFLKIAASVKLDMKILLVDDDQSLLTVFSTALVKDGFEAVTAETGEDGLNKAKSEKPDLILLDQVLPDISGNDVLKSLKADEETKAIPVMLLSNFSQEELVKGALEGGAIDYIFKYQVEPKDVVAKIKQALKM
jgi:twitching motility two-component system response regulator PilH